MEDINVILVDENDNEKGVAGKTEVHLKGLLHRAVSVFIINSDGDWLLQKRASNKYHSAGLWTNTCCTHPFPGESSAEAATRRLYEEMGIGCSLQEIFSFSYLENLGNGLTENEFDHVFIGVSNKIPEIDRNEVDDFRYISFDQLQNEIAGQKADFTVWFLKIYEKVESYLKKQTA